VGNSPGEAPPQVVERTKQNIFAIREKI
jgi:hypothetical protein